MRSILLVALLAASTTQIFAQSPGHAPGMQEGVQVHGDWVIDVRNPDGTLAHHHAFKNALVGRQLLATVMARGGALGFWQVQLTGDACLGASCILSESLNNLSVALSASGTEVILTGTVTADSPQATRFLSVGTVLALCPPAATPGSNCGPLTDPFSQVSLLQPILITANQMATVTVTFSFS